MKPSSNTATSYAQAVTGHSEQPSVTASSSDNRLQTMDNQDDLITVSKEELTSMVEQIMSAQGTPPLTEVRAQDLIKVSTKPGLNASRVQELIDKSRPSMTESRVQELIDESVHPELSETRVQELID